MSQSQIVSTGWSLGEVQALAIKASRGCGFSWGMAEEAGFAVRWLESAGMPGCACLGLYLDSRPSAVPGSTPEPIVETAFPTCPLATGTQLLDQQRKHPVTIGNIQYPLLLVPFLAAYSEQACQLRWRSNESGHQPADNVIHIDRKKIQTRLGTEQLTLPHAWCETAFSDNAQWHPASIIRVPGDRVDAMKILSRWASKTYAPATERSRLSGAGAGVTDND